MTRVVSAQFLEEKEKAFKAYQAIDVEEVIAQKFFTTMACTDLLSSHRGALPAPTEWRMPGSIYRIYKAHKLREFFQARAYGKITINVNVGNLVLYHIGFTSVQAQAALFVSQP